MTETLKVKTGITPKLKKYVFKFADAPYNLRNQSNCNCIISCTEKGIETASSIGTKLWELKLKYKSRVRFPKTVYVRYVSCSSNIQVTENKRNYSSYLHGEQLFSNIFNCKYI